MPLDAICIAALAQELSEKLVGAKIDKVQQPARDMIILSLHGDRQSHKLLISGGTGSARVHLTENSFENPQSPPMFCMLLRKHLIGARIAEISQPDSERMLIFRLNAFDDMGEPVEKRLIIEMMGRNSNLILVDHEERIIDCLRRMDGGETRVRQVLPGLFYHMPPKQEKSASRGLSPLIFRELCYHATGDATKVPESFSESEKAAFEAAFAELNKRVEHGEFTPTIIQIGYSMKDFSFMPILQYENAAENIAYPTFSNLLDLFYTSRDKSELLRRKSQAMLKSIKSAHERSIRKISLRRQELSKAGEREVHRKRGDLLTANLWRVKKGDTLLECEDYFEPESPLIKIPLGPLKTPQQNAAAFYKDYSKAKTAEGYLTGLIEKGEKEEAYLASVIDEIERAENERDLEEIRRELIQTGWIRQNKLSKKDKSKPSEPLKFISSAGLEILVGRNNAQNDLLTTKLARRTDMWLHAQKIHGSHVIISCKDAAPDDETIREAASLAAYFSQGRAGGRMPVDYTSVRSVKKPSGALPGAVIYTEYKTVLAEADEALVERLRVK